MVIVPTFDISTIDPLLIIYLMNFSTRVCANMVDIAALVSINLNMGRSAIVSCNIVEQSTNIIGSPCISESDVINVLGR